MLDVAACAAGSFSNATNLANSSDCLACPAGAFYVFPDVSALLGAGSPCTTAAQLAARILSEGGVALLPGTDFGAAGEGYLRLSYVRDMSTLEEGMKRMAAVVKAVRAEGQAAL